MYRVVVVKDEDCDDGGTGEKGNWHRIGVVGWCPACGALFQDASGIPLLVTRGLNRLPRD